MKTTMKYLVLCLLMFVACKKEDVKPEGPQTGVVTIYTTNSHDWSLIIDGVEYGEISHATQMPLCEDPDFQHITLSAGPHSFDARSLDGLAWGHPHDYNVPADGCIQINLP